MFKKFLVSFILFGLYVIPVSAQKTGLTEPEIKRLYTNCLKQDQSLAYPIFKIGIQKLFAQDSAVCKDKIIIVDYTQPSTNKRFYFLDLSKSELILHTYVAHGVNSGALYANRFSNVNGSNQSSLGFYHTGETYCGAHDLSVRLDGLEPNKNSNARERNIVIHRAAYANEAFILENGKLGRSFGCLTLPEKVSDELIEKMAEGVGVYVYWQP